MKIRLFTLFLTAVLILSVFSGCSASNAENRLNALEETVGDSLDALEEKAEDLILDALTTSPTGAPATQATAPPATQPPAPAPTESAAYIGKPEAEAIALKHAQLTADQVTRLRTEFDFDDGRPEYEVDFVFDGWEYDYKIHAETGEILSHDKDRDD